MREEDLISELKKIKEFLFEKGEYESSTQIGLSIDVIEDLFYNKSLYGYDDSINEIRNIIRKTIRESKD